MKVLIFAAGLGTRLRPLTENMPKALVPVCGKPLLWHVINKFKKAGFNDFIINVHHFAELIKEYISSNGSFGVNICFSDETDMLRETGGGIRHAGSALNDGEPFIVHNVDILSNLDIDKFVAQHKIFAASKSRSGSETLATLLVSERETQRYLLFNADDNLVGWMNVKTGQVRSPYAVLRRQGGEGAVFDTGSGDGNSSGEYFDQELFLSKYNLKKYAFDGVHVISSQIFKLMERWPHKFSIIDFYISICGEYNIKYHIQHGLDMIDVGKLDSLEKAEELATKLGL